MKIEELYQLYLEFPSVQTDTRKLKQGDLFFALKGEHFNGNEFARQAIDSGAAYAIIDEEKFSIPGKTFLVDNVLVSLQMLAKHHRQQFKIPFLAITGSNGKTTTKELVHAVLSTTYKTYTTEGNLNNHIGVPLTILKIKADAEMAVIEMGANHQKEIASYCEYAMPDYGLITNCGKAHLEGFGGEEGVRKGKGELFDYLREHNGTAFIMSDYVYLQEMSRGIKEIFTYGSINGDVVGQVVKNDPFLEVSFSKGLNGAVQSQLVGAYNLPNILAAAAVGKYFSVDESKIIEALTQYSPSNSRSQLLVKGNNKIILDAYNANPSSMKVAIENFSRIEDDRPKILLLGAMAELGDQSLEEHKFLIEVIRKHQWQNVLLVGGDFLKIQHPFLKFKSPEEAGEWLSKNHIENSYLLIKGSRSFKMEKVLDYI
ncbi:MAG TPA: UDP-N-acetylmuramoyl-tripeptide--D-alanyl-D-alanine ligase [Flavisolibacter sp.]|nr:UDP-N-acetylmuramoyl-tripeptide--D-alanyl-D-alanine ligase [Flavisolibacter sp.]